MKKITALLLTLIILLTSTAAYAGFSDVNENDSYYNAVNRLSALDIMKGTSQDQFDPQGYVTREEFCRVIVRAAGLEDTAAAMQGTSAYSDVDPYSDASGYINVAINKGFLTGAIDGNFHPNDNVNFAQVCTAVVRALGYTDKDAQGLWPKNYIEKASKLEITDGLTLNNGDGVQRWVLAQIIDKLLDTNIKKQSQNESDKSFADASGLFTECIILANSISSDKLADNQVLTDKGIYYYDNKVINLELGNTYRLDIGDNDTIKSAFGMQKTLESISVDGSVGNKVSYKNENKETLYKTLPDKTIYYYNGNKIAYDNISSILQTRSSIVFAFNKNNTGYDYAVIYDPIYSDPQVARGFDPSSKQLGNIQISGEDTVIRDGKISDLTNIKEKDVVYRVSDIWNKYSYILAVSDKAGGKVNDVFPDRVTPKYVRVDGKDYYFSSDIDINKLSVRPGSLEEDDNIVMLLGHDGKVVDLEYPGSDDNSNYAFVINYSVKISGTSSGNVKYEYSVKLLTADGITATYFCDDDMTQLKGCLVKYKWLDSKHITVEYLPYNYPKGVTINKPDRGINDSYASDNIRIFNLVSNEDGADAEVALLDYQDLPQGTLADNKVFYLNNSGAFNDVNIMLTNDVLGQEYKTAVIESAGVGFNGRNYSFSYKLFADGKEYSYGEQIANGEVGAVVGVKIAQGQIISVDNVRQPDFKASSVEAFDSRRIKVNGRTFWLNKNITVYFWDYDGNVKVKSLADIDIGDLYGSITLFLNKPVSEGGKVDVILVKQ